MLSGGDFLGGMGLFFADSIHRLRPAAGAGAGAFDAVGRLCAGADRAGIRLEIGSAALAGTERDGCCDREGLAGRSSLDLFRLCWWGLYCCVFLFSIRKRPAWGGRKGEVAREYEGCSSLG